MIVWLAVMFVLVGLVVPVQLSAARRTQPDGSDDRALTSTVMPLIATPPPEGSVMPKLPHSWNGLVVLFLVADCSDPTGSWMLAFAGFVQLPAGVVTGSKNVVEPDEVLVVVTPPPGCRSRPNTP